MQWLVPLGYDRMVLRTTLAAGIFNTVLATFLAPRFAHVGMAWGIVTTEAFVCITFLIMVSKTCPLWGKRRASREPHSETCETPQIGAVSAGSFPAGDATGIHVRGLN
jgi:hypothetical protein